MTEHYVIVDAIRMFGLAPRGKTLTQMLNNALDDAAALGYAYAHREDQELRERLSERSDDVELTEPL